MVHFPFNGIPLLHKVCFDEAGRHVGHLCWIYLCGIDDNVDCVLLGDGCVLWECGSRSLGAFMGSHRPVAEPSPSFSEPGGQRGAQELSRSIELVEGMLRFSQIHGNVVGFAVP